MKAIIRDGPDLIEYSAVGEVVESSSWIELSEKLVSGKTWVGFIPYEMGIDKACFFEAKESHKISDIIPFKKPELSCVKPFDSRECYIEKVAKIIEAILDGDVYQVNLSHESLYKGKLDPYGLFLKLAHNPYSAYFDTGSKQFISGSPEKLLSRRDQRLESCPIKGTAPSGKGEELLVSFKDQAELNMITDLVRSDLSWISEVGSVNVLSERTKTDYPHVHHLHSVIEAKSDLHPIKCIEALFPGGSITGCPKKAAMHFIDDLEKRKRGIYTGSIGIIYPNQDFLFNIAIRTLTYEDEILSWSLGGGITIDSDPNLEWEETMAKGKEIAGLLFDN